MLSKSLLTIVQSSLSIGNNTLKGFSKSGDSKNLISLYESSGVGLSPKITSLKILLKRLFL